MKVQSIALTTLFFAAACSTASPPAEEAHPIREQLVSRGFTAAAASSIAAPQASIGQIAEVYQHADGRTALLIEDQAGAEQYGLVFDHDGSVKEHLSTSDEVPYSLACSTIGYWSCYGSCVTPCWYDWGFGQGCNSDCSNACGWWADNICA